jgi:hypothetical protein
LELTVDPDVGPLAVEGDQVLDLGAFEDRERVLQARSSSTVSPTLADQ